MEALASYKQQQSIISSVLFILGTLYVTFPLCGCFHYARPACFTCCVGFLSLSSSQVNNKTGIIFSCYANANTDIHSCIASFSQFTVVIWFAYERLSCHNKPAATLRIYHVIYTQPMLKRTVHACNTPDVCVAMFAPQARVKQVFWIIKLAEILTIHNKIQKNTRTKT